MSDQLRLPLRALDTIAATAWAMEEQSLRALLEVAHRENGPALEALAAQRDKPLDNTARTTTRNGVAVIPVMGPLFPYANLFTALSGATSMQILATDFNTALADPAVKAILFNVDSPGGDVNGIAEMANMIAAARGKKPIQAYVGHLCCSAAYWLVSATDRITADSTAIVGSIGAVMTIRDTREADAKRGVKTIELVSSVSPDKRPDPATDAGKAKLQAVADRLGEEFVAAVAKNRGVSVDTVLSDFGKGGQIVGADAVKAGLIDGISSFESVLASLSSTASPASGAVRPFNSKAVAAASQERKTMEIRTVADLTAAYPDLVAALRQEAATTARTDGETAGNAAGRLAGHAAGLEEGRTAGLVAGATAERTRILGIQAHATPGGEKIVADAVADGTSTPDQVGARILTELRAAGPRRLEEMRTEQPGPVGTGTSATGDRKDGTILAADAAKEINAEIAAAKSRGEVLSFAEAGAKVRARLKAA